MYRTHIPFYEVAALPCVFTEAILSPPAIFRPNPPTARPASNRLPPVAQAVWTVDAGVNCSTASLPLSLSGGSSNVTAAGQVLCDDLLLFVCVRGAR